MGPWLIDIRERSELEPWLAGGPPERSCSSVMLVRGDGPTVRVFLPNALDAAKEGERRAVVWVKNPDLLAGVPAARPFDGGDAILAVTLARDGRVGGWVTTDRIGVEDAAFAFTQAETMHG